MKFKVRDRVKIRKDLEEGKEYNGVPFNEKMKKYEGEIAKITKKNSRCYELDIDNGDWCWSDDMLEHVPNLENGDIITRRDEEKGVVIDRRIINLKNGNLFLDFADYTKELKCIGNKYFDIIKVERPVEYKTVFERVEDGETGILNKAEKEYLKAVIKPFKNKLESICKFQTFKKNKEYLMIYLETNETISFPNFETGTMYKKMECSKDYTLKELGLDDED